MPWIRGTFHSEYHPVIKAVESAIANTQCQMRIGNSQMYAPFLGDLDRPSSTLDCSSTAMDKTPIQYASLFVVV